MKVDKLKILAGEPIKINDDITLYQPTLREIKDCGEENFLGTFHLLCSSAYDMPSVFADMGVDFMQVTDWEYFRMVSSQCTKEQTRLILGDLDLSTFVPVKRTMPDGKEDIVLIETEKNENGDITIKEDGILIDEETYNIMISYIKELVNFQHSGKKAGNAATAKILIMDDRKRRKRKKKDEEYESMFYDGIISLVNTEEFSYTYETVFDITLYQFMKSFIQIQGKKSAMALLQGSMSGFADTSKIPKEDMSWVYSDEKYKPKAKKLVNNNVK